MPHRSRGAPLKLCLVGDFLIERTVNCCKIAISLIVTQLAGEMQRAGIAATAARGLSIAVGQAGDALACRTRHVAPHALRAEPVCVFDPLWSQFPMFAAIILLGGSVESEVGASTLAELPSVPSQTRDNR